METLTGMYAYSKAGHDKGELYLIIKEDKESVTLCDGLLKTIEHPKKKNKKHIQPVKRCDEALKSRLLAGDVIRNEEIKRSIKSIKSEEVKNV